MLPCKLQSVGFLGRGFVRKYSVPSNKTKIIVSNSTNPFFNLTYEDWLFQNAPLDTPILFLWRNEPTVVIGKHQNPWKECHVHLMEQEKVHLVRRKSGGGAVYQDLGNSIWTFIDSKKCFSIDRNINMINQAIGFFGIDSNFSGRNDIYVGDKKVSGCAFKHSHDKSLHHGTLLLNIDKDRVERYLNVNKEKLKSKGVDSVRQRILNLNEINPNISHDTFNERLIHLFSEHHQTSPEIQHVTEDNMTMNDTFHNDRSELENWDWRFGKTPNFEYNLERRFPWGIMDLYLTQVGGKIADVKIYSDCLYPIMIEEIEKALLGIPYHQSEVLKALENTKKALEATPSVFPFIDEFGQWVIESM